MVTVVLAGKWWPMVVGFPKWFSEHNGFNRPFAIAHRRRETYSCHFTINNAFTAFHSPDRPNRTRQWTEKTNEKLKMKRIRWKQQKSTTHSREKTILFSIAMAWFSAFGTFTMCTNKKRVGKRRVHGERAPSTSKMSAAAIKDSKLTQCIAIVGFSVRNSHTWPAIWIKVAMVANRGERGGVSVCACAYMENVHSISSVQTNATPVFIVSYRIWFMVVVVAFIFLSFLCCLTMAIMYTMEIIIWNERLAHTQLIPNETNDMKQRLKKKTTNTTTTTQT